MLKRFFSKQNVPFAGNIDFFDLLYKHYDTATTTLSITTTTNVPVKEFTVEVSIDHTAYTFENKKIDAITYVLQIPTEYTVHKTYDDVVKTNMYIFEYNGLPSLYTIGLPYYSDPISIYDFTLGILPVIRVRMTLHGCTDKLLRADIGLFVVSRHIRDDIVKNNQTTNHVFVNILDIGDEHMLFGIMDKSIIDEYNNGDNGNSDKVKVGAFLDTIREHYVNQLREHYNVFDMPQNVTIH